ncbi:MAG: PorV/PorQ family protein [Rhodothermales bacterium]|nr:PorV/PorQ family protein [Rhodothermales bacterium]
MTISRRVAFIGALLMVLAPEALGQTKVGTTIGQFLLIEPSARMSAMGNAGVTMYSEASSAFYNPGALGHLSQSDAQFSYGKWLADITHNYAGVALRVGQVHTLFLSVTSLNSGEMDVRTVEQPLGTGERFNVQNLAFGAAYGRRITDRFSAGLQLNFIQERIWHSSLQAFGINLGVLYQLPFRAYLGASLSNFGTQGAFDGRDLRIRFDQDPDRFGDNSSLPAALYTESHPLPILFRVGVGIPWQLGEMNSFHLAVDAAQPSDNTSSMSFGGEWTFMRTLSLRGGYQNLFQQDSETGLTLGVGLQYGVSRYEVRIDYAWNDYGVVGDVQRFSVGVGF